MPRCARVLVLASARRPARDAGGGDGAQWRAGNRLRHYYCSTGCVARLVAEGCPGGRKGASLLGGGYDGDAGAADQRCALCGARRVEVTWQDGPARQMTVALTFSYQAGEPDAEKVRWYLEDYAEFPADPPPGWRRG